MFSGIIEEIARVHELQQRGEAARLVVDSQLDHQETQLGDSIAIEGVCLSVVEKHDTRLVFDVSAETLRKSSLEELKAGDAVNLERALQVGDRLSGHFVSGHVDGVLRLVSRAKEGNCDKLTWQFPKEFARYIAPKASIAIAGISLTVGECSQDTFCVYIIPHTSKMTTLDEKQVGVQVNFEVDMLARYLNARLDAEAQAGANSSITQEFLTKHGYA